MIIASIIGNIGKDAEVKNINGKDYISFSVASTEKQGEQETTTWVSVLASHNQNILPFLKKGQQVFVLGRQVVKMFQSNNNIGVDISVFAQTLQLCGGKKEDTQQQTQQPAQNIPHAYNVDQTARMAQPTPADKTQAEEDLPF